MRRLLALALLAFALPALAQGWRANGALAGSSGPPPPTGNVYFYITSGTCTGTSPVFACTGAINVCMSSNATSCGGTQVANSNIFYTLDGSAANEASTLYQSPVAIPDPSGTQTITINAVLVQTANVSLAGCSSGSPCFGVVVQDGMNVKAYLKTNVACPKSAPSGGGPNCPAAVFDQSTSAQMPTVQYGGYGGTPPPPVGTCTSGSDRGVRGTPTGAWYYVNEPQPNVDVFVANSDTTDEMDLQTAGVNCVGSNGDTEYLIPAEPPNANPQGGSTLACAKCTAFAVSKFVAHNHQGTGTSIENGSYLSELEMDSNQENQSFGTSTTCTNGTKACYGAFNVRCSMYVAAPVVVGSTKYGRWQYSSQGVNWTAFNGGVPAISHDCSPPFGTIASLGTTGCPVFTPGAVQYQGETAYPLEPGMYVLVDQGLSNAETILELGSPGGSITGCIRGIGGTAKAHTSGSRYTSGTVKVQLHATQDVGTGASCLGTSAANALYMDYASFNGIYSGTAAYATLMGSGLPSPSVNVLNTWGTQAIAGNPRSVVCTYFATNSAGSTKFFDQTQPYTKPGTGNPALVGVFDMHDNFTASWGIIGSPGQAVITQAP